MKKAGSKKHALVNAVIWTLAAIFAVLAALSRDASPLQIAVVILFIINAVIWWTNYAKKRQEEQNHE